MGNEIVGAFRVPHDLGLLFIKAAESAAQVVLQPLFIISLPDFSTRKKRRLRVREITAFQQQMFLILFRTLLVFFAGGE